MPLVSSVILCALRKAQEGAKRLGVPVPSLHPSSPCKPLIVLGRRGQGRSSGTKKELDPMGLWRRAKSSGDFVCDAYGVAGRTSLQTCFFLRKIKITELLCGHYEKVKLKACRVISVTGRLNIQRRELWEEGKDSVCPSSCTCTLLTRY